jgi:hypothetical protein
MSPELEKYYSNRLDMMSNPAWKDLMEDIEAMIASTNDISSIQDEKTLHYRRGELSMMRWMLNLQSISETTYQDLLKEH